MDEIRHAVLPCLNGHCGFVEITRTNGDIAGLNIVETQIMWCRFCGKIEVYENVTQMGEIVSSDRIVNLNSRVFSIIKELL